MKNTRLVYSSDGGRVAGRDLAASRPAPSGVAPPANVPQDGVVRVFRERAGRNGKVVTVIRGLPRREMDERATQLKRLCGAGGAVKADAVEIQGDHRERVADALRALGHTVKLAGG